MKLVEYLELERKQKLLPSEQTYTRV
jgi:hypothetical protein